MTGHKAIQLAASRSKASQLSGRNASGPREILDFPRGLLWKAPTDRLPHEPFTYFRIAVTNTTLEFNSNPC